MSRGLTKETDTDDRNVRRIAMGRAVSIPPLDMTPEQLAKALLRPVKQVLDEPEKPDQQKLPRSVGSASQDKINRDSA